MEPITIHGLRHTFHGVVRQQGVPDKHLHDSRGVTMEAMRQASRGGVYVTDSQAPAGPS